MIAYIIHDIQLAKHELLKQLDKEIYLSLTESSLFMLYPQSVQFKKFVQFGQESSSSACD